MSTAIYHLLQQPIPMHRTRTAAVTELESLIERGRSSAARVVAEIQNEQPLDFLIKGKAANFALTDREQPGLILKDRSGKAQLTPIHRHALGQVGDKIGIPWAFIESLRGGEDFKRQLLIHNLNQLAQHQDDSRYLVRSSHGEIRGFLSDRYRRMDSRPLVDDFVRAISKSGAVPFTGVLTDTSFSLRAVLPIVHEPVPGEAIAFGMELCNSDFGARALSVSLFILRIWCSNLAVMSEELRRVHLGPRLGDGVDYSERTRRLDTATIRSAINDLVNRNFLPERLETVTNLIRRAAEERVSPSQLSSWMKKNLTKAEAEAVGNAFTSPDIEMLPPGQSRWRFSNCLSWFAGTLEGERKLDMERLAGSVLAEVA